MGLKLSYASVYNVQYKSSSIANQMEAFNKLVSDYTVNSYFNCDCYEYSDEIEIPYDEAVSLLEMLRAGELDICETLKIDKVIEFLDQAIKDGATGDGYIHLKWI